MKRSSILVYLQFFCITWMVINTNSLIPNGYWLLMIFIGFFIGVWAVLSIQFPNLSIFPEPKEGSVLIQHGPYRWIRHPMYVSLLMISLSWIGAEFSMTRITVWCALLTVLLLKIQLEEKKLIDFFPDYEQYACTTWRLVPFVY